ncbi:hypothetical protein BU25DRAFT_489561 [Macroventuria anomochaeta]|uniref:Uncharacterized protein n=1 Tax=Macroventuria anomochaeta TaxID=301207 RepID=A0ACB6S8N5_9PLEO|nr:uncharacterized protein BU25DRAFT_489561 [Macroventuria anomochaeta]KAF2629497.1 hypothetical protein BU25DRAFT_489561 [Macroventuria anomochaeta]
MSNLARSPSPEFTFDDSGRPFVQEYSSSNKFRPGQKVNLHIPGQATPEGPYKIETSAGARKYTLCSLDGQQQVRNGQIIDEDNLAEA